MAEPFVQAFTLPDGSKITSVVLDKQDFDAFCEELRGIFDANASQRTNDAQIAALKAANMLPMMKKGTKTQKFFDRWNVQTEILSVIVRGQGKKIVESQL